VALPALCILSQRYRECGLEHTNRMADWRSHRYIRMDYNPLDPSHRLGDPVLVDA